MKHLEKSIVKIQRLMYNYSNELKQQILSCQGELHLATIDWALKNIYGIRSQV